MKTKDVKRREAQERQERWNALNATQKLNSLRKRRGHSGKQIRRIWEKSLLQTIGVTEDSR